MGKTENGFTIIEVMLFLAVTGMLAATILVGSGVAIGQQRYRDSVNSLKSLIQEQYSQTTNVTNDRSTTWTCDSSTNVAETPIGAGQPRGTSDCVLLGRLIVIDDSGTKVTTSNVVGYRTSEVPTAVSDVLELQTNYVLGVSPIDQDTSEVAWGAQVVKPKTTTPMPVSVLIVRSPLSGSVFTFTVDGVKTNPNELITSANLTQTKDLCVNADVGSFVGRRLDVRISPFASGAGAIQIPPESTSVCD